ncbi:TcmI family type II polyketide cyclase [Streptomyces luteireticuli]|uniref:TcmI family type II polyketide cyclase n=1 Tax=Streptomyces luteireticuli TaxID=173858 RepID=UPI003555D8FD
MEYTLIVARMAPEDTERVSGVWAESDATELPRLAGVRQRRLFRFNGLYFQLIGAEAGMAGRIEGLRGHPLFQDVNRKLKPFIEAYDPLTWRSPRDAMAEEFYAWNA